MAEIYCPWCGRELPRKPGKTRLPRHTRPDADTECTGSSRCPLELVDELQTKVNDLRRELRRSKRSVIKLKDAAAKRLTMWRQFVSMATGRKV